MAILCVSCSGPSSIQSSTQDISGNLLQKLTSVSEGTRFSVIAQTEESIGEISKDDVEKCLTSLQDKNVSTLIYIYMKVQNDILYTLNKPAEKALLNSKGSFPNIAFYYSSVKPKKGLKKLIQLYENSNKNHLAICKAIGKTKTTEGIEFLISEIKNQKKTDHIINPLIAGLNKTERVIDKEIIIWALSQNLNREELIALSSIKTNFSGKELFVFYTEGELKKQLFVIQYVFREPDTHFETIKDLVEIEFSQKNYNTIIEWMMSDKFHNYNDLKIKKFRETTLELAKKNVNVHGIK